MNRIAIDIRYLSKRPTGVGRYIQKLITHLDHLRGDNVQLFLLGHPSNFTQLEIDQERYTALPTPYLPEQHPFADIWFYQKLPSLLREHDISLFHATAIGAPLKKSSIPWIVTIHDLAGFVVPSTLPTLFRTFLNWQTKRAILNAHQLIITTQSVQKDIQHYFQNPTPSTIIPLGFEETSPPAQLSEPGLDINNRFILFVGTLEKRKGLANLLEAYHVLQSNISGQPVDLVLCGKMDAHNGGLLKKIENSPFRNHIHLLGYVDEAALNSYYKHSSLTVIPSLYEGFGLPLLEAMQGGAPILVNDLPVFRESGGDLIHYTSFQNKDAAAKAMANCLRDQNNQLDRYPEYRKWLDQFSWTTLAQSTLDLYLRTIESFKIS
jgi:glycosyltransferase involved in cell wall biosynthesis